MNGKNLLIIPGRIMAYAAVVLVSLWPLFQMMRPRVNPYWGKALGAVIPKRREEITPEDLLKLNREQLLSIFHQLVAPDMSEMKGEYRAQILDSGNPVNRFLCRLFLHFTYGSWLAKAFKPIEGGRGYGYNLFSTPLSSVPENPFLAFAKSLIGLAKSLFGKKKVVRLVRNKTTAGPSVLDNRTSFHLVYRDYNSFPVSTMKDEVRKINDNLYLGVGMLSVTGGKRNLFPFMLIGPPEPWVGPDTGYPGYPYRS